MGLLLGVVRELNTELSLEIVKRFGYKMSCLTFTKDGELPVKLLCDIKVAITITNNPVQHDKTKRVEIDKHFISEKLDNDNMCIMYIPSNQQIADVLIEGLTRQNFDSCISKLGLIDIYAAT